MLPNLSRLSVAPTGAHDDDEPERHNITGAKRDRDDNSVTLTVSSDELDPKDLKLTFEITEDSNDGSLFVKLVEPQDCKFSFSVNGKRTTADSGGYACEKGRGARVLPRLIVGAMHALEQKDYKFKTLLWRGEAVCNLESEWNHDEYKNATDKEANVVEQAQKIGWRLDYYARLKFAVDKNVDDVADNLREALKALEEEGEEGDEPTLADDYVSYGGDVVKLSQEWKEDFKLSVTVE